MSAAATGKNLRNFPTARLTTTSAAVASSTAPLHGRPEIKQLVPPQATEEVAEMTARYEGRDATLYERSRSSSRMRRCARGSPARKTVVEGKRVEIGSSVCVRR